MTPTSSPDRMSPLEIRASLSLASLFALRMLGLFLILPVFAVHASQHLTDGDNRILVGLALGIYGLTQGILQIPFGMASDRYGRKPVIVFGLVLFAAGSFVAAAATDIWIVVLGRAIQGAGAISAAVVAMTADLTRDQHRTKAMAMIGASIGLTFAFSLMAAPVLYVAIGMGGMFLVTGLLALAAIFVVIKVVPPQPQKPSPSEHGAEGVSLGEVLRNVELLRLNFGIFTLHMVQMAMFVVIPVLLVRSGGLPVESHWEVYLPVVLVSFALMLPPIFMAERRGKMRLMFLGSIALLLLVQVGFAWFLDDLAAIVVLMIGFFVAFNILEASLPSLVSRLAPVAARGTAIGVYNTTQALGLFAGGVVGGWLAEIWGNVAVFVFGMALIALWLVMAWSMRVPGKLASRTLKLGLVGDVDELREKLEALRGVRQAVIKPEQGIAVLTVQVEIWDEQSVVKLIGGQA